MTSLRSTSLLTPSDVRWSIAQATRAPSVMNTQPWRFDWDGHRFALLADTSRGLTVNDPEGRELVLSCGAALYNLRLALRKLGLRPSVTLMPEKHDPRTLALVDVAPGEPADAEERRMFAAMSRRHTHRGAFDERPLSAELAVGLQHAAEVEGAHLIYVHDPGQRTRVLELARAAERLLSADTEARNEMSNWTPAPHSSRTDGVPAFAYPRQRTLDTQDLPGRDFDLERGFGTLAVTNAQAGAIAVLATDRDVAESWLTGGQALERVLVAAAERSAFAALHTQATEIPHIRNEVQRELCTAAVPQLLLRFGYAEDVLTTPRRPIGDVLDIHVP